MRVRIWIHHGQITCLSFPISRSRPKLFRIYRVNHTGKNPIKRMIQMKLWVLSLVYDESEETFILTLNAGLKN